MLHQPRETSGVPDGLGLARAGAASQRERHACAEGAHVTPSRRVTYRRGCHRHQLPCAGFHPRILHPDGRNAWRKAASREKFHAMPLDWRTLILMLSGHERAYSLSALPYEYHPVPVYPYQNCGIVTVKVCRSDSYRRKKRKRRENLLPERLLSRSTLKRRSAAKGRRSLQSGRINVREQPRRGASVAFRKSGPYQTSTEAWPPLTSGGKQARRSSSPLASVSGRKEPAAPSCPQTIQPESPSFPPAKQPLDPSSLPAKQPLDPFSPPAIQSPSSGA